MNKIIPLFAVILLVVSFNIPTVHGAIIVATSSTATADNFLDQGSPTTNNGTDDRLVLGDFGVGFSYNSIMAFTMPTYCGTITELELVVSHTVTYSGPPTIDVYQMTRTNFTNLGSTWNKYDGTNNWTTAGGDYTHTIVSSHTFGSIGGYQFFPLIGSSSTNPISSPASGSTIGLILVPHTANANQAMAVASGNHATASIRPYLYMKYDNSTGCGGGGTATTSIPITFATSTLLDVTGAFTLGSTTISLTSIDFGACDVTSITVNPFASSSLGWGTFSIPTCVLQSVKFLFFGLNGFDTYRITNFVNQSSSTLPFTLFKFASSALVFINPVTGALRSLPTATSTNVFQVPFASTTIPISINASTSTLAGVTVPSSFDDIMASIELVLFSLTWGFLFKSILT